VSAFPAVVGPVLFLLAEQRGPVFAARAAEGTLLGLVALGGFALAYGSVAIRASWGPSLLAGWACAIALGIPLTLMSPAVGLPAGLAAATVSLSLSYRAMPRSGNIGLLGSGTDLVRVRIATTAALIVVLTTAAELLGATIGGVLTALPLLASVLASFTHRGHGPDAALALLRGMLAGMAGFVAFCAVVAALLVPDGVDAAFGTATLAAVAIQTLTLVRPWRARKRRRPGPRRARRCAPRVPPREFHPGLVRSGR
jgi:hypothetical protein